MSSTSFTRDQSGTMKEASGQSLTSHSIPRLKTLVSQRSMRSREWTRPRMIERSRSTAIRTMRTSVKLRASSAKLATSRITISRRKIRATLRICLNRGQWKSQLFIITTTPQMRPQAKNTHVLETKAGWKTASLKTT